MSSDLQHLMLRFLYLTNQHSAVFILIQKRSYKPIQIQQTPGYNLFQFKNKCLHKSQILRGKLYWNPFYYAFSPDISYKLNMEDNKKIHLFTLQSNCYLLQNLESKEQNTVVSHTYCKAIFKQMIEKSLLYPRFQTQFELMKVTEMSAIQPTEPLTWFATTASCGSSGSAAASNACRDNNTVLRVIAAALKLKFESDFAKSHTCKHLCCYSHKTKDMRIYRDLLNLEVSILNWYSSEVVKHSLIEVSF